MHCKNCHTKLQEQDDYCNNCGGRVIRNRLTIKNLFQHFGETYFNYDNTLLKTFVTLFKKPEDVIDGYINGTRKKYINVINYFALAITVSGIYMFIISRYFPEAMDFSFMSDPRQEALQKKNMAFIQEYQSIVMMLYVPIYALMAKVVFFNLKTYNYTELLVIFLYIQAQISITSSIVVIGLACIGLNNNIVGMATIPLMIIYSAYCLKRLYKLNFSNIILKTLLFLIVLGVTLVIITIIMITLMYFNGTLEETFGPAFEAGRKIGEEAAKAKSTN